MLLKLWMKNIIKLYSVYVCYNYGRNNDKVTLESERLICRGINPINYGFHSSVWIYHLWLKKRLASSIKRSTADSIERRNRNRSRYRRIYKNVVWGYDSSRIIIHLQYKAYRVHPLLYSRDNIRVIGGFLSLDGTTVYRNLLQIVRCHRAGQSTVWRGDHWEPTRELCLENLSKSEERNLRRQETTATNDEAVSAMIPRWIQRSTKWSVNLDRFTAKVVTALMSHCHQSRPVCEHVRHRSLLNDLYGRSRTFDRRNLSICLLWKNPSLDECLQRRSQVEKLCCRRAPMATIDVFPPDCIEHLNVILCSISIDHSTGNIFRAESA